MTCEVVPVTLGLCAALLVAPVSASLAAPAVGPFATAPVPFPGLPVVSRVRVEVDSAQLVLTEDVRIAKSEWRAGDLDAYVAFGAPGAPRAFDAHIVALDEGAFEPRDGDAGEPVTSDRSPRRPPRASLLLGRENMAGVTVHLKEPALRRAFAASGAFVLRLRSLISRDAATHEVLVRLGAMKGAPLALGAIDVAGEPRVVARASARLCGPHADPYPLAVRVLGAPAPAGTALPAPAGTAPRGVAPWLAVRHDDDDLCVRF